MKPGSVWRPYRSASMRSYASKSSSGFFRGVLFAVKAIVDSELTDVAGIVGGGLVLRDAGSCGLVELLTVTPSTL
jgi:hypothetical protein